jgi:homoserine dehydrogenase
VGYDLRAMPSAGSLAASAGSATTAPLRVAVLGAGTVGREVVHTLQAWSTEDQPTGPGIEPRVRLGGVAVRDLERARGLGIPDDQLTDAPAHLVAAPDTDVVVELMGGDEPARTLILAALRAGKAVVTANKHVLAHHGPELEAAAREAGAALRFEAAVGGGIPVLAGLAAGLAGNRIDRVRGIVNGTTNHILSALDEGAGTYEAVLRDAQQRGYAEADPSGDVEGRDAVNKLVVLARLAFGRWLPPSAIDVRPPRLRGVGGPGITGVTADQLAGARAIGLTIKLIASAGRSGDRIEASVMPTGVRHDSLLGRTGGVRNRIEIAGAPIGMVGFDGPGAGGPATSSAVLADVLAITRGEGSTWTGAPPPFVVDDQRPDGGDRRRTELVARRWFLLLPGIRRRRDLNDLVEAAAPVAGGFAIRTTWLDLQTLRARVLPGSPATLDAPCYPIDDD